MKKMGEIYYIYGGNQDVTTIVFLFWQKLKLCPKKLQRENEKVWLLNELFSF
jgi:hypothetical protein